MIDYKKMIVVDKILKIFLCLILVFIFTIMKPKEEAEAAVPVFGWVAGILGGLVIDIALDQGLTFADKNAEKDFKNKIVTKVWNAYGNKLQELKPNKLNAVKWAFKAPKWLIVVIVDAVADVIQETRKKGKEKEKDMADWGGGSSAGGGAGRKFGPSSDLPGDDFKDLQPSDPYFNTDLVIQIVPPNIKDGHDNERYNYFVKYIKITVTPIVYQQKSKVEICVGTCANITIDTSKQKYLALNIHRSANTYPIGYRTSDIPITYFENMPAFANFKFDGMVSAWNAYKTMLAETGQTVITFDDFVVLDKPRVVLDLPDVVQNVEDLNKLPLPSTYNDKILDFDITEVLKPQLDLIPAGSDFEWDIVNNYIVEQGDNFYQNNYVIDYKPVINNKYEVSNEIIEDFDDGKFIPIIKDEEKVNELDGSFNQYIKNFYNYFADGIITSIDGFKQLNSSVNSIFTVFANYFTFLPIEFRTLFFSGASMSVLLGVLYWGRR